jgi:hypothetical protein
MKLPGTGNDENGHGRHADGVPQDSAQTRRLETEHSEPEKHRTTDGHTAAVPAAHTRDADDADYRARAGADGTAPVPPPAEREALLLREKEAFGGMKFGSAFFGWLTATGMAVLLTALVAAAGAALGLSAATGTDTGADNAAEQAAQDPQTVGIVGGIVLLLILFIAYYAGGYVAGRMARFNGAKQGLAVWLWAVIVAILVAVLGLALGKQFDVFANLNAFPRLPLNEGELTTAGLVAVVAAALVALLGAILGGLAGMRFHRRVDRADYDDVVTR